MTRAGLLSRSSLLAFVLGAAFSCDDGGGCGDDCDACQASLDHMQSKILDNACNPAFMEKAVSRIEEDCGDIFPPARGVGAIFEWCQSVQYIGGAAPQVQCSFTNVTRMAIRYRIDSSFEASYPSGLVFVVEVDSEAPEADEIFIDSAATTIETPLGVVTEGAVFGVEVYDASDADRTTPVASGLDRLFIRQSAWDPGVYRTVTLTTDIEGAPELRFEDF